MEAYGYHDRLHILKKIDHLQLANEDLESRLQERARCCERGDREDEFLQFAFDRAADLR